MRSARERDGQGGGAGLCVVGGQAVHADGADGDRVDTGRVAVTVAVIVSHAAVSCRPDENVAFAATTLKSGVHELLTLSFSISKGTFSQPF